MALAAVQPLQASDLIITEQLAARPDRAPNLRAENEFLYELSVVMSRNPRLVVPRFLEVAMELCGAGSAGISILRLNDRRQEVFQWYALAGRLASYAGGGAKRENSLSGLCIDKGKPVLVENPARAYRYYSLDPPIEEALLVPLYDNAREAMGTLWIMHHDAAAKFCANDARVLEQLAVLVVLALKLVRNEQELHEELWAVEADLSAERMRRELAERKNEIADTVIREVNHRVKNTIQMTASLLGLQARSAKAPEAKAALTEAMGRLAALQSVHELLYRNAASAQEIEMAILLQELTQGLVNSHPAHKDRISLIVDADPVMLDAHQAIPLALIANEAVTNAYKHAFPNERCGAIHITLHERDRRLMLEIRDDGVGMPHHVEESRMGLKLVRSLASQAGATFDVARIGSGVALILAAPVVMRQMRD